MPKIVVIETCVYVFDAGAVPEGVPVEDWFCGLNHPAGEAEAFSVPSRVIETRDSEESGVPECESCGAPILREGLCGTCKECYGDTVCPLCGAAKKAGDSCPAGCVP